MQLTPIGVQTYTPYNTVAANAPVDASSQEQAQKSVIPPVTGKENTSDPGMLQQNKADAKVRQDRAAEPCYTCENRKYQDGSDDPGVSFKSPATIDPDVAASVVMGHEMEHVVHEQARAESEGRRVVMQSVQLHSDICPECGRTYIAGGTTRTVTKKDDNPLAQAFAVGTKDAEPDVGNILDNPA